MPRLSNPERFARTPNQLTTTRHERIATMNGAYIQTKGDANKLYDKAVRRSALLALAATG